MECRLSVTVSTAVRASAERDALLLVSDDDVDRTLAHGIDEALGCPGISNDNIDIIEGGEADEVIRTHLCRIAQRDDGASVGNHCSFYSRFLAISGGQPMIEGEGVGADERDISAHERQCAEG